MSTATSQIGERDTTTAAAGRRMVIRSRQGTLRRSTSPSTTFCPISRFCNGVNTLEGLLLSLVYPCSYKNIYSLCGCDIKLVM